MGLFQSDGCPQERKRHGGGVCREAATASPGERPREKPDLLTSSPRKTGTPVLWCQPPSPWGSVMSPGDYKHRCHSPGQGHPLPPSPIPGSDLGLRTRF